MFFGRYADVLNILPKADQRARFYVVVAMVFHKGFDHLSGLRVHLDLVEYDDALAFIQRHSCGQLELLEQHVEVVGMFPEGRHNIVFGI